MSRLESFLFLESSIGTGKSLGEEKDFFRNAKAKLDEFGSSGEKNNHLIDLEIKNSFLSFRLLNWRFMDCLIYSIVFLFLIIKKLRCSLIKYNNFKIVQRLLCFFFFSISPNVEDDSIIWLTDDWYLTIYIRNTYFSRLTYSCSYEYISLLIIKYSQHFFSASLSYNKWQNSYNV